MLYRSPLPGAANPSKLWTSVVLRHASWVADKAALIDSLSGHTLPYRELPESVKRAADGLAVFMNQALTSATGKVLRRDLTGRERVAMPELVG